MKVGRAIQDALDEQTEADKWRLYVARPRVRSTSRLNMVRYGTLRAAGFSPMAAYVGAMR